jgi:Tol biopolymer transport system component/DNA-binding winged helix-turn-helix (wHTH) protein
MPESIEATARIRFSDFEVDLTSQELFKAGAIVRLPNQSFVVLAMLLGRAGQPVSREELRARVWPDGRVVEFEQGLNAIINRLREALGDSAEHPQYVETLPRRGYRFIGHLESGQPTVESATPARVSLMTRVIAAACIAVVSLGITWVAERWMPRGQRAPAITSAPGAAALTTIPLTTLLGQERMPALSPDGTRLMFAWDGETGNPAGFDLFVRALDSERLTRVTHAAASAIAGAWSPDGTRVAFTRTGADGGLFVMASTGGEPRKLADAFFTQDSLMQPAWSPDGSSIVYSAADAQGSHVLHVLRLDRSVDRILSLQPQCWHAGAPSFSPDGRALAMLCISSVAVYSLYLLDPEADFKPLLLENFQGLPLGTAWRDPNHLLIANDSGDGSGLWELDLKKDPKRRLIAEESMGAGLSAHDGRIVFSRARQTIDIWRVTPGDPRHSAAKRWIFSTRAQMTPQYSADGARIAFQSNRSGSPEIWVSDADGSNAVRITEFNGPLTGAPSWCSDGRRLAFDSRASGASAIYVVDTLERVPRKVATPQANLALPVWSKDCRWLIASDGREALYRVPADGGEAQRFTMQRSYQAAVVGDRVIFNVAQPSGVSLWIKPIDGGAEAALRDMPQLRYADSWAASADAIYFTAIQEDPVLVKRYELATGKTRVFGALPNMPTALGGLGLAVSPDGNAVLYTHTEDSQSDLVLSTETR